MGCNIQKTKRQSIKLTHPPLKLYENAIISHDNQEQINGQKNDIQETEICVTHQPEIGRRLKHMVSVDELQKFIDRKNKIALSPYGFKRRKQSLMNSPKL